MANARSKKKKKGNKPVNKNKVKLFPPNKLVEIAFYSFVMFVLGVFVGRSSVPVFFEVGKPEKTEQLVIQDFEKDPMEVDVKFYDDLSSDDDFKINEKFVKKYDDVPVKTPIYKDTKKKGDIYHPEKNTIAEETLQSETIKKTEKKVFVKPVKKDENFSYTIQVAALKDKSDADALSLKLVKSGFIAYSVKINSDDGALWYRVRVGKFQNQDEAEKIKKDLIEKLNINGLILKVN